jgi:hypothetical protein
VTPSGEAFFARIGIDLTASRTSRRVFCRPCIDWSERRAHLAGAVGAALANRLMELRWIARKRDTRALSITPIGWSNIERTFGCSLHDHTVQNGQHCGWSDSTGRLSGDRVEPLAFPTLASGRRRPCTKKAIASSRRRSKRGKVFWIARF